jgi:hypothetical protein
MEIEKILKRSTFNHFGNVVLATYAEFEATLDTLTAVRGEIGDGADIILRGEDEIRLSLIGPEDKGIRVQSMTVPELHLALFATTGVHGARAKLRDLLNELTKPTQKLAGEAVKRVAICGTVHYEVENRVIEFQIGKSGKEFFSVLEDLAGAMKKEFDKLITIKAAPYRLE